MEEISDYILILIEVVVAFYVIFETVALKVVLVTGKLILKTVFEQSEHCIYSQTSMSRY